MAGRFQMKQRRPAVAAGVVMAAALAVSGCGSGSSGVEGAESSRIKLYASSSDLAADSALIATGTVVAQKAAADITPDLDFTLSTVRLTTVAKGAAAPGSTVVVRQVGSQKQPAPTPLMGVGSNYLLYLTPSGLAGDLGKQYYVTGGNAGLYVAAGGASSRTAGNPVYTQSDPEPGENLPSSLTPAEALGKNS